LLKKIFLHWFIKPDTHIRDIFIGLNISKIDSSDFQIFRDVIAFSNSIKQEPYKVDKLFWLIGSGNFYKSEIQVKTNKQEFVRKVKDNL